MWREKVKYTRNKFKVFGSPGNSGSSMEAGWMDGMNTHSEQEDRNIDDYGFGWMAGCFMAQRK